MSTTTGPWPLHIAVWPLHIAALQNCATLPAIELTLLSQHNTMYLFDLHPTVYQGPLTPIYFQANLSTWLSNGIPQIFWNTNCKNMSFSFTGCLLWLEWGDQSQKLGSSDTVGSLQIKILPAFPHMQEDLPMEVCENRQAGKVIVKMFLEAIPCSGVTNTALKLDNKGQMHTRSPSLNCKFSWRESEQSHRNLLESVNKLTSWYVLVRKKGALKPEGFESQARSDKFSLCVQEWWGESQEVRCKWSGFLHWGLAKNLTPLFA